MPKRHRHRESAHAAVGIPGTAATSVAPAAAPGVAAAAPAACLADPKPQHLADLLLDPSRVRPVVVISRLPDLEQPRLDGEAIALELKGVADVVVITNGPPTYEFERLMPRDTHIFGSAARVYPPGLTWTKDPYSSPLRVIRSQSDIEPVTARIVSDAEDAAFAGGWKTASLASVETHLQTGLVKSVAPDGSRAVIELASGLQSFLPAESTGLGIPLHWILGAGLTVSGTFDDGKRIFSIGPLELPAAGVGYADGCVVPALVLSAGNGSAEFSLVPGHSHTVPLDSISSNELDSAEDLLTVGEVVAVRLRRRGGQLVLSMLDVDDSEPVLSSPEIVPGGGPWLVPGRDLLQTATHERRGGQVKAPAESPQDTPAAGARALHSVELALATERSRRQLLEAELAETQAAVDQFQEHAVQLDADVMLARQQAAELSSLHQELDRHRREAAVTSQQLSQMKKKLRGIRKEEAMPESLFPDPQSDFDFELKYTWAVQIPALEKARRPLGPYRIGAEFLQTLREQPKEKQKKAFKAIVDLLSNDTAKLSARDAHLLRTHVAGGAAPVVRNNGQDVCWRLSLEQNVAAARRLHYWKCADGVVELSRVTVHDGTDA